MTGHPPGSAAAASHFRAPRRHAQPLECGLASFAAVPSLPKALADVSPDPSLFVKDGPPVFGEAIKAPPAFQIAAPLVAQFYGRERLPRVPLLPDPFLKPGQTNRCNGDEQGGGDDEPGELAFLRASRAAFCSR